MKTLFELAQFHQEKAIRRGEFMSHCFYLIRAARDVTQGYSDLKKANEENQTRIDCWGNEIEPSVVWEACNFLNALKENALEIKEEIKKEK